MTRNLRWAPGAAFFLLLALEGAYAQSVIDGKTNLIVNGDAEAGPAGKSVSDIVSAIPGWTRSGTVNVLPYGLTGLVQLTDPAPPDHKFNYFAAGSGHQTTSTLTQVISLSPGDVSTVMGGSVKFTASAYLGSANGSNEAAGMTVAFQNSNGQTFNSATLAPLGFPKSGMSFQQQTGLVPAGTSQITVTLSLNFGCLNAAACFYGAADSLSVVLSPLGTAPGSVLGKNLVVNGGAEAGPSVASPNFAPYIPGWSTSSGASVSPYGGYQGFITSAAPGPPDRGVSLFYGGPVAGTSNIYQDIDVTAAASLIDAGQVQYEISAWLGGLAAHQSPTLTYEFFDWTGKPSAPSAQLGPVGVSVTSLKAFSNGGSLPAGTRLVHIALSFHFGINAADTGGSLADNINFTLSAPNYPPVIDAGGVVSATGFGGFSTIAPGTFVEIYGYNLATSTRGWAGSDFVDGVAPTSLDGVSVSVGGQPAFVNYISPGQVNVLVPSDVPTGSGTVEVTVSNANGASDPIGVYINATEPGLLVPSSFNLNGKQYVAATLQDGTFALPAGAIPQVASRPAKPGETVTIYGIGFGGVTPDFPAGTLVTKQNALTTPLQFLFGTTAVTPAYAGLAPTFTGLYQFNVVIPKINANNAEPLSINLGGTKGSQTLYIAVGN